MTNPFGSYQMEDLLSLDDAVVDAVHSIYRPLPPSAACLPCCGGHSCWTYSTMQRMTNPFVIYTLLFYHIRWRTCCPWMTLSWTRSTASTAPSKRRLPNNSFNQAPTCFCKRH